MAYTVIDSVTAVDAVNALPCPSLCEFQPAKRYPLRVGFMDGSMAWSLISVAAVFGLASVSPPFLSNVTVYIGVHVAYTVIDSVTAVDAVNAVPYPSFCEFQPAKWYPLRVGGAGNVPTVVSGTVTAFVAGLASVSPPFLSNVTV